MVLVWDVMSGAVTRRLQGHFGKLNAVAFSNDAGLLASGKQRGVDSADNKEASMQRSCCGICVRRCVIHYRVSRMLHLLLPLWTFRATLWRLLLGVQMGM